MKISDINVHVIQPDKEAENVNEKEKAIRKETVYTYFGKHDYLDDKKYPILSVEYEGSEENVDALAAKLLLKNRYKYLIKFDNRGHLFNPNGMYIESVLRDHHRMDKKAWFYREVSKEVFDLYINFLRTKNQVYLLNAERKALTS